MFAFARRPNLLFYWGFRVKCRGTRVALLASNVVAKHGNLSKQLNLNNERQPLFSLAHGPGPARKAAIIRLIPAPA
jgi:hypothetical protein